MFYFLLLLLILPFCFGFISEEFAMVLAFLIYFSILFQSQNSRIVQSQDNLLLARLRILSSVRWSRSLKSFINLLAPNPPSYFLYGRMLARSNFFLNQKLFQESFSSQLFYPTISNDHRLSFFNYNFLKSNPLLVIRFTSKF